MSRRSVKLMGGPHEGDVIALIGSGPMVIRKEVYEPTGQTESGTGYEYYRWVGPEHGVEVRDSEGNLIGHADPDGSMRYAKAQPPDLQWMVNGLFGMKCMAVMIPGSPMPTC